MKDLRYPIGTFTMPANHDAAQRLAWIDALAALPGELRAAVQGLGDRELAQSYRDGGWTLRQVVHHLADSHVNAYVRTKLALTEDQPPIKVWDERAWSELADGRHADIAPSLAMFDGAHRRWVECLRALPPAAFARTCFHAERGTLTVDFLLGLYVWHGRHHVAHITTARQARGF